MSNSISSRLNLPDYVVALLVSKLHGVRWKGGQLKACCPFHDEATPSFTMGESPEGICLFYCFGCGRGGTINSVCWKLGINYRVQIQQKARVAPKPDEEEPFELYKVCTVEGFPAIYDYYLSRGISEEICLKFNFRFDLHQNTAILPVTTNNFYLGYIRRHLDPSSSVRYEIQRGMPISRALWGFDFLDLKQPTYIMEGIIDAAIFWSQGLQAVALCNKTWTHKTSLLQQLEDPIVVPDNYDPKSLETFNEIRKKIGGRIEFIPLPYKDAGEYVLS